MTTRKPKPSRNPGVTINSFLLAICAIIAASSAVGVYAESTRISGVYNEELSPKINAFLELNQRSSEQSYTNGVLYYDHNKKYCASFVYGYDEENVYAHATCKEIAWRYYYNSLIFDENGERYPLFNSPVKITRESQTTRAWSSYVKLAYKPGTDFEFTSYALPEPGSNYYKNATEMFKMKRLKLPPAAEMEQASKDLEARFHADNDNAPMPDYIEEIYGMKNPQIVY